MKTIGIGALVVCVVMAAIGVTAGLNDDPGTAIPALAIAFLALATGVILIRE